MRVDCKSFDPQSVSGFIALEGVNGAGKSSLQKRIGDYLSSKNIDCLLTREPGGTPLGSALRDIVQGGDFGKISHRAEFFLFSADRAEHVESVIKPALNSGKIVITDRFFYSSSAFQGYGRNLDRELIDTVNNIAVAGCFPDLVVLLDLDPEVGLQRIKSRKADKDTFEEEKLHFHRRIRSGFLMIAEDSHEAFVVLNAEKREDELFSELRPYLDILIEVKNK